MWSFVAVMLVFLANASQVAASEELGLLETPPFISVPMDTSSIVSSPAAAPNSLIFPNPIPRETSFSSDLCGEPVSAGEPWTCTMTCADPSELISGFELSYESEWDEITINGVVAPGASGCSHGKGLGYRGSGRVTSTNTFHTGLVVSLSHIGAKPSAVFELNLKCRPNLCSDLECENCGIHANTVDGCTCKCPPGVYGVLCEFEEGSCAKSGCMNGATCFEEGNGFVCVCGDGYEGDLCEIDVDDCEGLVCDNDSQCIDEVDGYRCELLFEEAAPVSRRVLEVRKSTFRTISYWYFNRFQ